MTPMLTLDGARQLAADRHQALRAAARRRGRRASRTGRTVHQAHERRLRPVRRLLDWLDRTTPATGLRQRRHTTAVGAGPC